ncbi:hypothetical protein CR194_13025 [Salipaludibacillus keqinensis]|uniref:Uncharacterized protein n=1 Tax=Salipaludibacillus keqinensis TaxID=2045207 RepID=A0A323TGA4_9BACI|nr:hypothetical protein CR194_13025 [Salipaludibacillus keqinensis]
MVIAEPIAVVMGGRHDGKGEEALLRIIPDGDFMFYACSIHSGFSSDIITGASSLTGCFHNVQCF